MDICPVFRSGLRGLSGGYHVVGTLDHLDGVGAGSGDGDGWSGAAAGPDFITFDKRRQTIVVRDANP